MKLINTKKVKKKFDPTKHWLSLLCIVFLLILLIFSYSMYSFLYIKKQISLISVESAMDNKDLTLEAETEKNKENAQFLNDINNINIVLDKFDEKEAKYNDMINGILKISNTTATATIDVATSTE